MAVRIICKHVGYSSPKKEDYWMERMEINNKYRLVISIHINSI